MEISNRGDYNENTVFQIVLKLFKSCIKCIKSKNKMKSNLIATNNVTFSIKTVSKPRLCVPTEQNIPE